MATLHIIFVLQPYFSLLSFTAAADALITVGLVEKAGQCGFSSASASQREVLSDLGITITADALLQDIKPGKTDTVIVCGGY